MKIPATLLLATLPVTVFGLGFRLTDINTEATARGGAFAATADNASAIYYNPAGITQLDGTQALMGAYTITYESSFNSHLPGGSNEDTKWSPQAVPSSFITTTPKGSSLSLGLGIYSPFGLGLEYNDDAPFRTLAKKAKLQYITISPVAAWKFGDTLSIAVGPTVNFGRVSLSRGIVTPGDEFQFDGQGVSYGFVAGILWQPAKQHSFGLTYHSASNLTFSGHTRVRIPGFTTDVEVFPGLTVPVNVPRFESEDDADATLPFPQTIVFGYSFRPTPKWNFEFDIEWTDWDSLNVVTINQSRGGPISVAYNYESSFFYDFGVTRTFDNGMRVSAGYIYSENSVPNESFNPLVPDSNRHVLSVGVGRTYDRISWDVGYQYAYGPHRNISNGSTADGSYRFQSNAFTFAIGYRF